MKTIKAIIIDDEKHARETLCSLVEIYCPKVEIVGEADNIFDGQKIIEQLSPDLVFLDISIGENTGFELIDILSPFNFQLIFITAYDKFATKAFRVNALDYLLKPIEPNDLKNAIEKVSKTSKHNELQSQLANLIDTLKEKNIKQISIASLEGITFLEIEQIIYISASGNYSTFYLDKGEKIVASKNLKHYELLLKNSTFYRCHQSNLVNLRYIKKIITKDGNTIIMKDGSQIPIAKKRKEALLSLLYEKFSV